MRRPLYVTPASHGSRSTVPSFELYGRLATATDLRVDPHRRRLLPEHRFLWPTTCLLISALKSRHSKLQSMQALCPARGIQTKGVLLSSQTYSVVCSRMTGPDNQALIHAVLRRTMLVLWRFRYHEGWRQIRQETDGGRGAHPLGLPDSGLGRIEAKPTSPNTARVSGAGRRL